MIHYQLQCSQGHGFDGWFKDSAGFERQAKRGLIDCPQCGDAKVTRALMAPAIASRAVAPQELPSAPPAAPAQAHTPGAHTPRAHTSGADMPAAPGPGATHQAAATLPDALRAKLQRLRAEIERNCDYVGPNFAEEARRIHTGEADARAIYGETTKEQAEALAEDGVPFASIPWVPPADG